jgi:hypothetical protein
LDLIHTIPSTRNQGLIIFLFHLSCGSAPCYPPGLLYPCSTHLQSFHARRQRRCGAAVKDGIRALPQLQRQPFNAANTRNSNRGGVGFLSSSETFSESARASALVMLISTQNAWAFSRHILLQTRWQIPLPWPKRPLRWDINFSVDQ